MMALAAARRGLMEKVGTRSPPVMAVVHVSRSSKAKVEIPWPFIHLT